MRNHVIRVVSFLLWLMRTHSRCRVLLLHLITIHGARAHACTGPHFFLSLSLSVWLLWTRDQPVANTSTWQHTTFTWDRNPCAQRDTNPQPQQASGRSPRPRDHDDRPRSWYSGKMTRTEFKYRTSTFQNGLWKMKETVLVWKGYGRKLRYGHVTKIGTRVPTFGGNVLLWYSLRKNGRSRFRQFFSPFFQPIRRHSLADRNFDTLASFTPITFVCLTSDPVQVQQNVDHFYEACCSFWGLTQCISPLKIQNFWDVWRRVTCSVDCNVSNERISFLSIVGSLHYSCTVGHWKCWHLTPTKCQ